MAHSPHILKRTYQGAFTLVELVLVILLLTVLGITTSSYIGTGVDIYSDISERDKLLNNVRFVMERMRREISNALPNSALVNNDCLSFYPIKSSSQYIDFPFYPEQASQGVMTTISDYDFTSGDRAVVYLLDESELSTTDSNGSAKSQTISSVNSGKDTLTFSSDVSFSLSSPASRTYIINEQLTYCFVGSALYRQVDSGTSVLMAEGVSGSFQVIEASLQRNSLVKVSYSLDFDGQEVTFEQTLHINNVP